MLALTLSPDVAITMSQWCALHGHNVGLLHCHMTLLQHCNNNALDVVYMFAINIVLDRPATNLRVHGLPSRQRKATTF